MLVTCRACGNCQHNVAFSVREMMLGLRDEFEYFQCDACECIQAAVLPDDLGRYYPSDYYSFNAIAVPRQQLLKRHLKRCRTVYTLTGKGLIGRTMAYLSGSPLPEWLLRANMHIDSKILDLGCGSGQLLLFLQSEGFSNLTGYDPLIATDIHYDTSPSVHVYRRGIEECADVFDAVFLHHSLEHIWDPCRIFESLSKCVVAGGLLLIRTPIATSYAWRHYGTNWVQLDAPRHLCIHSPKSIALLASRGGFGIELVEYDSSAFQFWGSEQYVHDIPLYDPLSHRVSPRESIFSETQLQHFASRARALNAAKEGDQACFYLRRIAS